MTSNGSTAVNDAPPAIPLTFCIRGEEYSGADVHVAGRAGAPALTAPDPARLLNQIILRDAASLGGDFRGVTVQDIIDFLVETGKALAFERNPLMQEACRLSSLCSGLTPSIVEACYRELPRFFTKPALTSMVENEIGARFLDGWVEVPVVTGRACAGVRG